MRKYKTIVELQAAIQRGEVATSDLTGFNCKYELFIQDKTGEQIFSAYYGTNNAVNDVCALLGIAVEEV